MTVTASNAVFSFAPQANKIADGTFNIASHTWYRHRGARVQMGTVQNQQPFPQEIGGLIVPTGMFKDGAYFAGSADVFPRLESTFGWLLYATMGNVSSVAGPEAGTYEHIFRYDPADTASQPWLAARVSIPGSAVGEELGEAGYDCKIANMTITAPAAGPLSTTVGLVGRVPIYDIGHSWTYDNAYENTDSVPMSGGGYMKLGGVEYPIMGAEITVSNNLTSPQDERIVGSYHPDDFVALNRVLAIRFAYKYKNPDLTMLSYGAATDASTWNPLPYTVETVGADPGVDIKFNAAANIGATATPYSWAIRASRATISPEGPPMLQGGQMVTQMYTLLVQEPLSGEDYAQLRLINGEANYNWPT